MGAARQVDPVNVLDENATAEEVAAEARPLQRDVFVFIADVADNPEIKNISTEQINQGLRRRRQQFERLQASH